MGENHMNRQAYQGMIDGDIDWLSRQDIIHGLEYSHIIEVLKVSVSLLYGNRKDSEGEE